MKINVIDLSSLLKVTQFETNANDSTLLLTACSMRDVHAFETETIKLEVYRILKEEVFQNADKNVFLLGNYTGCIVEEVLNSLKQSVYKKQIKELTKTTNKDTTVKNAFIQNQSYSENILHTLLFSFSEDIKTMIKDISSTLHLKNVLVTEHSHLRFLDYANYSLVSIERTNVRVYNVEQETIKSLDTSNAGVRRFLDLQKSSKAYADSFEWDLTGILEQPKGTEQYTSLSNGVSNAIKSKIVIVTGGGSNTKFIKESKDLLVISLEELLQPMLSEPVSDVLLRYVGTSLLAADAVAKGQPLASLIADYGSLDVLERRAPMIYSTFAIALLAFLVTFQAVNVNRNMYATDAYLDDPLTNVLKFGYYSVPSSTPIDYTPASASSSVDMEGLNNLLADLNTKVENLSVDDESTSRGATVLQIREYVSIYTKSELYGVERTSPARLDYMFRGNVGDVKTVEDILKLYYSNVKYTAIRIDDLDSFSVMVYKFTVTE